jgi:predicted peroxiredoxin
MEINGELLFPGVIECIRLIFFFLRLREHPSIQVNFLTAYTNTQSQRETYLYFYTEGKEIVGRNIKDTINIKLTPNKQHSVERDQEKNCGIVVCVVSTIRICIFIFSHSPDTVVLPVASVLGFVSHRHIFTLIISLFST